MKALTLTDYINEQLASDKEFAALYAREEIINYIIKMIFLSQASAGTKGDQKANTP